ncbi:7-cyano-7-deazaguanine synthase [Streptomyces lavendulae]|uniref:7-cyano-7-deazaguanine synthase n=1 Tax=Streptomyces lavendulae TaxID=1914 RepID=UPI0024A40946|nr:7-cyano-7-deazaguanine synthase [Streptomyces lavendulae]GLW04726.1 7-cyano-7-deazaguanine synthase [Streptomyces lavendulae subsp. lavendulae]
MNAARQGERVAVLASGGLDSSVLIADLARQHTVLPVYCRGGLRWESLERSALNSYLRALDSPHVQPLTVLEAPTEALYGAHWSTTSRAVPDATSADDEVYLPGRNIILIGLTAVWCTLHDIHTIAIGSLADNPFPDATDDFFHQYGRTLSAGLKTELSIHAPYRSRPKHQIIAEFAHLPLHLTLTCLDPRPGRDGPLHCGNCNKCAERRHAFAQAAVEDRTSYAHLPALHRK